MTEKTALAVANWILQKATKWKGTNDMMDYNLNYQRWIESPAVDQEAREELLTIDEKEKEDRFYRELEFGTAGMRGVLGAGTNRMNIYNVRRASQGVAEYVKTASGGQKGVLIGYDTRNGSRLFAEETARVLAANGIKVYLFDRVHSVPEVSFGIRKLGCAAGVMITASHNPKEYNGYKVYGADGGQMPPEAADAVIKAIDSTDVFDGVKLISLSEAEEKGLLQVVGKDLDEAFLAQIQTQQLNPQAVLAVADHFKLIYTPFHGTGSRPIKEILKRIGFKNLLIVQEQDTEDGNFPTVKSPNPEDKEGFALAIEMAKRENVDLIIGTDPDCDRVGVVVRDAEGIYRVLTGNQTGALLVEYILASLKEKGSLPQNGVVIKTIVTTELATAIANAYGVEMMNVLTGFKYIGEKMTEFEKTGAHTYLYGFEESYGCLIGTHARDKDGVVATMMIAEMAAFYKTKNMSLFEAMQSLYEKYGYYAEKTVSFTMSGKDGMSKMAELLKGLRTSPLTSVNGMKIISQTDYLTQTATDIRISFEGLPKSDVLKCDLSDGKTYFIVRPSGTEPKIKFYLGTVGDSYDEADAIIEAILTDLKRQLPLA